MRKVTLIDKNETGIFTFIFFLTLSLFIIAPDRVYSQDQTAVVVTAAADYSSGAHSIIPVDPIDGHRTAQNDLLPTGSDLTVASYGQYFYRIERSNAHNITKFDISAPSTPVWQYSTEGSDQDSNPHDLIFVSSEKAYVLRYGTSKAWIVDPSADTEANFKTGELDLSPYSDTDGNPEMHSGIIVDGYLFITLQRIDFSGGWGNYVYNTPYVAVFDTTTDQEVDTGKGTGNMKGIPLPIENPGSIQYLASNDTIYVQGVGQYTNNYTGGIASINPNTYDTSLILDDGDANDHPYGAISGMIIISPTKGYFVGYAGWGDNTLYSFDPSSDNPTGTAIQGFENKSIAGMEGGVYLDKNNMLWVCNQTDAQVDILNVSNDTIDESISTNLNPIKVVFTTEGTPGTSSDTDEVSVSCFIATTADYPQKTLQMTILFFLIFGASLITWFTVRISRKEDRGLEKNV